MSVFDPLRPGNEMRPDLHPAAPTPPVTQPAAAAAVTASSTQRSVISLDLPRQLPVDCYADNCFIIDMSSLIIVL